MYLRIISSGHSRPLAELQFSPRTEDGLFLISACLDKAPMVRDGETGDWIGTFEGHKGAVWSAKLNQAATLAVTGSADFTAKLWDAMTGDLLQTWEHRHIVKTVDFSRDAARVATGGKEKKVRVFSVEDRRAEPELELPHDDAILKVLWLPDGNGLLTGTENGKLRHWDVRAREVVKEVTLPGPIMDLELSSDDKLLTVAAGKQVVFLDVVSLETVKSHVIPVQQVEAASLRQDGRAFIAGGSDPWVRIFDFETGAELECLKGHHGPVHCLRYAPDGGTIASGANDATIRLWRLAPEGTGEDGEAAEAEAKAAPAASD